MSILSDLGFEHIKHIGRGQYGLVTLVRCVKDRSICVCKTVDLTCRSEKERVASFREVELLKRLHHPNVVQYLDHFAFGETLVIAMEYCANGDLATHIRDAAKHRIRIRESAIMGYLVQIFRALEYVHGEHILHRDLKTSNVFLTDQEATVKLGDFGISRLLESSQDVAMSTVGTPQYMSPEVCESRPYTYKSDVWSLGCIAYELCVLKHAFAAENLLGLMCRIIEESLEPIPTTYSAGLDSLIRRMLTKADDVRPSVAALLEDRHVVSYMEGTLVHDDSSGGARDAGRGSSRGSSGVEACVCRSSSSQSSVRAGASEHGSVSGEKSHGNSDRADIVIPFTTSTVGNVDSNECSFDSSHPAGAGVRTVSRSVSCTSVGTSARSRCIVGPLPPSTRKRSSSSVTTNVLAARATTAEAEQRYKSKERTSMQAVQTQQAMNEPRGTAGEVLGLRAPGPPGLPRPSRPPPPASAARVPPRPVRPPPVRGHPMQDELAKDDDHVADRRRSALVARPAPAPLEELVEESWLTQRADDTLHGETRLSNDAASNAPHLADLSEAWLSPEDLDGKKVNERRCIVSPSYGRSQVRCVTALSDDGEESSKSLRDAEYDEEYEDDFCSDDGSDLEAVPTAAAAQMLKVAVKCVTGIRVGACARLVKQGIPSGRRSQDSSGSDWLRWGIGQDKPACRRKLENLCDRDGMLASACRIRLHRRSEEDETPSPCSDRSDSIAAGNKNSTASLLSPFNAALPGALPPSPVEAISGGGDSRVAAHVGSAVGVGPYKVRGGTGASGGSDATGVHVYSFSDVSARVAVAADAACGTTNGASRGALTATVSDSGSSAGASGCSAVANDLCGSRNAVRAKRSGRHSGVMTAVASLRCARVAPAAGRGSGRFGWTSGHRDSPKGHATTTSSNRSRELAPKVHAHLKAIPARSGAGSGTYLGRGENIQLR
eukprot:TRINITY_DN40495_c0_g1_i1.p1 TRINITY_DN40495_c0_g1~~TRINITY_DN40495_c0_g1_i1.p1  ORF type:complete len:946 (-),score=91.62 TRINITY_DN40495_c0_g1_i1:15-2852(-)